MRLWPFEMTRCQGDSLHSICNLPLFSDLQDFSPSPFPWALPAGQFPPLPKPSFPPSKIGRCFSHGPLDLGCWAQTQNAPRLVQQDGKEHLLSWVPAALAAGLAVVAQGQHSPEGPSPLGRHSVTILRSSTSQGRPAPGLRLGVLTTLLVSLWL